MNRTSRSAVIAGALSMSMLTAGGAATAQSESASQVIWGIASGPGWEFTIVDEQGVTQLRSPETGCQVTYRQILGARDAAAAGIDAQAGVDALLDKLSERAENFERLELEPIGFRTGVSGEGEKIEFATASATYTANDGLQYIIVVAGQYFDDVELGLIGGCPSEVFEGEGGRLVGEIFANSTVVESPY